jgi:hypothetical protein
MNEGREKRNEGRNRGLLDAWVWNGWIERYEMGRGSWSERWSLCHRQGVWRVWKEGGGGGRGGRGGV